MRRHLLLRPRLDTLSHHQRRVLAELGATPDGFVLYGGAALALRLAHRRPDEFSFLSAQPFDPLRLLDTVPYLRDAEVIRRGRDTLTCLVDRGGIVRVSFAGGVSSRVEDPDFAEPPGIRVASLVDLAATTVQAVGTRSRATDHLDIDALLRLGEIPMRRAFGAAAAVFGDRFDLPATLNALTSFRDGDLHRVPGSVRKRLARAADGVDPDRLPQLAVRPGLQPARRPHARPAGDSASARSLPVRRRRG